MTAIIAGLVVFMAWWALARRRRRAAQNAQPRDRVIADAWTEAARRAEPITVDLDPPADESWDRRDSEDDDDDEPPRGGRRR
jgi:hypothetical protein